jgi:hypothetical protein
MIAISDISPATLADPLPVGAMGFIPLQPGWRTGVAGVVQGYLDHPIHGRRALLLSTDGRTFWAVASQLESYP